MVNRKPKPLPKSMYAQLNKNATKLYLYARRINKVKLLDRAHSLSRFCTVLEELFNAFRYETNGRLDGPGGVAAHLKITRPGVEKRARAIGIDPKILCDPTLQIDDVLHNNPVLKHILYRLKSVLSIQEKAPQISWPSLDNHE